MTSKEFLHEWKKDITPSSSRIQWNESNIIILLEDYKSHLMPSIDILTDIDTIGNCANCGVEYHIHKLKKETL